MENQFKEVRGFSVPQIGMSSGSTPSYCHRIDLQVDLLGDAQGIIHFDAEITHGRFQSMSCRT